MVGYQRCLLEKDCGIISFTIIDKENLLVTNEIYTFNSEWLAGVCDDITKPPNLLSGGSFCFQLLTQEGSVLDDGQTLNPTSLKAECAAGDKL